MTQEELFSNICTYVCNNVLTFEERRSMGIENFHKWVKENYIVIPKSELEVGKEYKGNSKNASTAIWDGKMFHYQRHKSGTAFEDKISHYEDDNGFHDVFVPIKEK